MFLKHWDRVEVKTKWTVPTRVPTYRLTLAPFQRAHLRFPAQQDESAVKPSDWDESAPAMIPDPAAQMPEVRNATFCGGACSSHLFRAFSRVEAYHRRRGVFQLLAFSISLFPLRVASISPRCVFQHLLLRLRCPTTVSTLSQYCPSGRVSQRCSNAVLTLSPLG